MAFFGAGPGYSPAELGSDWGKNPQTQGYDSLITLFMRSDTPTGISTAAWGAPNQYWDLLRQAINQGKVVVKDPQAWGMLQEKQGWTPQTIGGAALTNTNAQPGAGGGGGGASGTDAALQDYYATITANAQAMQAAQLAYQDWVMRTGDDKLAFEKAQQAWLETYQQATMTGMFQGAPTLNREIADWTKQYQQAGLSGYYQGKPTLERETNEAATMTNLLTLQGSLRGPANYSQYLKTLGSTPQGMRDVVNAAAGRYTMPGTSGATPGATYAPATVQSLLGDVTTGGAGAQAEWSQALSGGLPAANQISTLNWGRMNPTQQSMLMSAYEGEGHDPLDVLDQIKKAAPTNIAGPKSAGTYKF